MEQGRVWYAHTRDGQPEESWQTLVDHLTAVAELAAQFASRFDSADWAYLAGLWHDFGKAQDAFQRRLRGEPVAVEHSLAGAEHALQLGQDGLPLAWVIAGHHAGLANWIASTEGGPTPLKQRLYQNRAPDDAWRDRLPESIRDRSLPTLPSFAVARSGASPSEAKRRFAFWIRILFSSLVDADYLDTERFMQPEHADLRGGYDAIGDLWARLDAHLTSLVDSLPESARETPVNRVRAAILRECIARAESPPGVFSLSAPTGGGKTLSSMAFALRHALAHGLDRVLVILPFTSIIEQNARVYREALGAANVLEHHADLTPDGRAKTLGEEVAARHARAVENWDAPVVVSTTVQFLESLHANRPGRCRKLHRIARSVIILDEVQTLPPELLLPILDALNELVRGYGCSLVLSTATPPALTRRESLRHGLPEPAPIVTEPAKLSRALARVRYHWPDPDGDRVDWPELADAIAQHKQGLIVVDRRADAYALAQAVSERTERSAFHLSTLMCAAHRLDVIDRIRSQLAAGEPCHVVSTQLIEAGVDLDFPVVYRALTGLDHIVQAAGRCNREGRLERGDVFVFIPPKDPPAGTLRRGADVATGMLRDLGNGIDTEDPELFDQYFRSFYGIPTDHFGVLREAAELNLAEVAAKFKMIREAGVPVVCPYGDGPRVAAEYREAVRFGRLGRKERRALQPYLVQVYTNDLRLLKDTGKVIELDDWLCELAPQCVRLYDPNYGLQISEDTLRDPEDLIVS